MLKNIISETFLFFYYFVTYVLSHNTIEYAKKYNNNSKAAIKYHTTRQQIKRWRDKYDGTIASLFNKSRRPKSHPNQHTVEELELIKQKHSKFKTDGLAQVYVEARKCGYTRSYDSMCKKIRLMSLKTPIRKRTILKAIGNLM